MRILFVTAAYLPESIGGVELHIAGLARVLKPEHEILVFCRGSDPGRPEFDVERYEVDGIAVYRVNYLFSDCDSFARVYRNENLRKAFDVALGEFRPDVVHVHHLTCLTTDLVDAARERGVPVVMTLHDFWMGCPRGQRMTPDLDLCADVDIERCAKCLPRMWSGWFGAGRDGAQAPADESRRRDLAMLEEYHVWMRGLLLRIDQLVTPSESSRDVFARYGIPADRIRVVENGIEQRTLRQVARTPSARFRFGYIGTVLPTKGAHVLLEAFQRLDDPGTELHIHGEASPWHEVTDYGSRLQELAEPCGDRVVFHGRYEAAELPAILGSIDALVVPSLWYEAFCLTLREGFVAGVPLLASRIGAVAEGVVDEETGLLFEPGDADDLVRVMRRVMEEPELRNRLVEAPKRVRTVEENVAELLDIYRAVVTGARPNVAGDS